MDHVSLDTRQPVANLPMGNLFGTGIPMEISTLAYRPKLSYAPPVGGRPNVVDLPAMSLVQRAAANEGTNAVTMAMA